MGGRHGLAVGAPGHTPAPPPGPADGDKYVLRGGAWNSSPETCRTTARFGEDPGFQDACFARDAIGFRCVRRAPKEHVAQASIPLLPALVRAL